MTCTVLRPLLALLACIAAASALAQSSLSRLPDRGFRGDFQAADAGPTHPEDAARLLAQATFGPTLADIDALLDQGYAGWLDEQFAAATSLQLPYLQAVAGSGAPVTQATRLEAWWLHALGRPDPYAPVLHRDQLRQRIALALSEIFVVSDAGGALSNQPYAMASFYDTLANHADGNYRDLLEAVTLHPAMGVYLSMLGNRRPYGSENISPDENYAREALQLFSIGLAMLAPDGSVLLDGDGEPIPSYSQATIEGFAQVYTGWKWNGCHLLTPQQWLACRPTASPADARWRLPMTASDFWHAGAQPRQLLDYPDVSLTGGVLPAGGTAQGNLDAALDNIFEHPNVGPFIGRQLIQRLVTSNPSPDYVARISAVFADNGHGVRGDLEALTRAILLDPEARFGHWQTSRSFGKLREPLLRISHLWRAMDAVSGTGRYPFPSPDQVFGQAPGRSPSVFNFFYPHYALPGEVTALGLVSPEFQISTENWLTGLSNALGTLIFQRWQGAPGSTAQQVLIDLDRDAALSGNVAGLLERYDLLFLSGQISPHARSVLASYVAAIANSNAGRRRVQETLFLLLSGADYATQK